MARGNRFGAFEGVFTPSILTILGVIMYMRLPWLVGQAGLNLAIAIIVVAHVISITTGLSVSSIATDKSVQAGGPYYIISRSMGLPIGGTLGLALCVGLAFSISLYIIGFTESLLSYLDEPLSKETIRIYGTITLGALTALTFVSTRLAIKSQFLVLAAIVISLFAILLGPSFVTLYNSDPLVSDRTHANPLSGSPDFAVLFGIFFPAVTGFTAGVNMSGDLRNPRRAIPRGTLAAIGVGLLTYIGLAVFLAIRIPAEQLANNPDILLDISLSPAAVYAGIWGATLSSALGSILGAPRILQALSLDRITPRILGNGYGKTNEPRIALVLVALIALGGILVAELDAIARIVSVFFICTYGFLNLVAAIESWANPDFRPEFRIPVWVSLTGLVTCGLVMVKLDLGALAVAIVLLAGIFVWLTRRELALESGDTWAGVWSSIVRSGLHRLDRGDQHDRLWRPNILAFTRGESSRRSQLLQMGQSLVSQRGVLTDFELVANGAGQTTTSAVEKNPADPLPVGIFRRRVETDDPFAAMGAVCRYHGFSGLEPNTVLLDWEEHRVDRGGFDRLVQSVDDRDFNLLMLAHDDTRAFGRRERVDVWLSESPGTVPLSFNLVRFLTTSDEWRRATVRFLVINEETGASDRLHAQTRRLVDEARLDAVVKVLNNSVHPRPWEDWVREESSDADLTVAAMPTRLDGRADSTGSTSWLDRADSLVDAIGSALLIRGSEALASESALFVRSTAPATAESSAPSADEDSDLEPLVLPEAPAAAAEVERFAAGHSRLLERFHERGIAEIYGNSVVLVDRVRVVVDRYFAQLGRAEEISNPQRRAKLVGRARSAAVFQWRKLLEDFERTELVGLQTSLGHAVQALLAESEQLEAEGPDAVVIARPRSAFTTKPGESLAQWVFEQNVLLWARLGRHEPVYYVPTRPLLSWCLNHRTIDVAHRTVLDSARDAIGTLLELGKALSAIRPTLVTADEVPAEAVASQQKRLADVLDGLQDVARKRVKAHASTLRAVSRDIARTLATDFDRIDVVHHTRYDRRVPRQSAARSDALPDMAATLVRNESLVLRRSVLALTVGGLQQRLNAMARRTRAAVTSRIQGSVLKDCTRLRGALAEFAERLRAEGDARFATNPGFTSTFEPHAVVSELLAEVHGALSDVPDHTTTAGDENIQRIAAEPCEDADPISLSVRRSLQFLVEAELVGELRAELARIPSLEQRAVGVCRDVIRLIQFNQSDFEAHEEGEESVFAAVLGPVVENGLGRIDSELVELEGLPQRLGEVIDRQLRFVLGRTDAYAITASPKPLEQYVRGAEGGVLSTVGKGTERLSQAARSLLAQAIYRRSAGVELARRLGSTEVRTFHAVERALELTRSNAARDEVLHALPFYYSQLFLGKSTINEGFWVGRAHEMAACERAIAHYRAGYRGGLVVVGERSSGKSSLCQMTAARAFAPDRIHPIYPPPGGSIDPRVFQSRLEKELGVTGDPRALLGTLPEGSCIVLHGLESWWERSEGGLAVIQGIRGLVDEFAGRHMFVMNLDVHAFRFLERTAPLSDEALAVVECGPIDARTLGDMITLRHRSTGLRFRLDRRHEDDLSEWQRARHFTSLFDYSGGNPGVTLQAWIAHIDEVDEDLLELRRPGYAEPDGLASLRVEWLALLLQLVLHRNVTMPRLERITGLGTDELRRDLLGLDRVGLLYRDAQGIIEIDRYAHHLVVRHLIDRGLLP